MKGAAALADCLRRSADAVYAVPGYPVTELAEILGAQVAVNEKVALEYALGDSIAGRRAAVIVKNAGLNVCADPLVTATVQGVRSGVVIAVGDDIDAVGSQTAQDSRYYGEVACVPVLEPDGETCTQAVEASFAASEAFSRVALLRLTPSLLEGEVAEGECTRRNGSGRLADRELTMRGKVAEAERLTAAMFSWSRASPLNRMRGGRVAAGAAPGRSRAVTVYPPPADPEVLEETCEYGRPFLREHRFAAPPEVRGPSERYDARGYYRTFCRECPFAGVMETLSGRGMKVICDTGCSLFAINPPYSVGLAGYGLGSSVAVAATSTGVALTGDYALLHSGINALVDVYERRIPVLCIVLKNNRMGMTGGQPAYDVMRYLRWADPTVCSADDADTLDEVLVMPEAPCTVVIEGRCPEGGQHETVAC